MYLVMMYVCIHLCGMHRISAHFDHEWGMESMAENAQK